MSEEPEQMQYRRKTEAAGFAQMCHLLTLDQSLSDGAFRVYALLLKYARQAGGCWPGVERLAKDLGTGQATIKRRVAELTGRGLITRERRYGRSSVTWIEDLETIYGRQPDDQLKNEPIDQLKNDPIDQLKSEPTEEQAGKNKQYATTDFSSKKKGPTLTDEQQKAFDLLLTLPRMDPATARRTVQKCDLAHVAGWVAEGKQAPPEMAAALVIRRLTDGDPPPAGKGGDGDRADRQRYIAGEYADIIEH